MKFHNKYIQLNILLAFFFPLCFSGGNPVCDQPRMSRFRAEQFPFSGYGGSLKCLDPHKDINPTDERKRQCVRNVVDPHSGHIIQYHKKNILRELNKAYCGFRRTITKLLLQICPRGHWKLGKKQPYSGWLSPELAEMSNTSLLTMRTCRMNRNA